MVPARGLTEKSEQQSFEIFFTPEFRAAYDKIYGVVVSEDLSRHPKMSGRLKHLTALKASGRPKGAAEDLVKAYETVNKFLCAFIEKNLKEFPYVTRDKNYFEKFLGAVPETLHGTVFLGGNTHTATLASY
ncbi:hypothetical protein HDU76_006097 [Blyttiomyces sp. JEL0837]|nr:hypothetical protein HDU76_006097 [Blyttiomyces sp. JEL0837]